MTSSWPLVKLGELVAQRKETVPTKPGRSYRLLGVRWYGQGSFVREEVTTESSKASRLFAVHPGDFIYNRLFAWKGSFGVIPEEQRGCYVSGEFPLFEVDSQRLLVEYLNLFMCRPALWSAIEIESTGSTSISRNRWKESRFSELPISLPSLVEQRRIVDLVASVDAYITGLEKQVEAARTARNAVLRDMLTSCRDSWVRSTLGDIAEWRGGITPSMQNERFWRDGDIPWVSSGDVLGWRDKGAQKFVTSVALDETSLSLMPVGTVLVVVRSGILAHTLPVVVLAAPATVNQDIKAGIPCPGTSGEFLALVISAFQDEILQSCRKTGTTVQSISTDAFLKFEFHLPPLSEQLHIVGVAESHQRFVSLAVGTLMEARRLRSGLLEDLLSGRHEIPESYDKFLGVA